MPPSASFHVSRNRLEGSLCDTSFDALLASCHRHLITGTIAVTTPYQEGLVELRAGAVETARFGELENDAAIRKLRRIGDGMYELAQQLPQLSGDLGDAAEGEGDLSQLSLIRLMQHCEHQALSCTITLVRDFDRAEISYRAGELVEVTMNGRTDDDAIVEVTRWDRGKFRISAPPLPADIDGWPTTKDPTVPFQIQQAAAMLPSRPAAAAPPAALPGVNAAAAANLGPVPGLTAPPASASVPNLPRVAVRFGSEADAEPGRLQSSSEIIDKGMPGWQIGLLIMLVAAAMAAWVGVLVYLQ